MSKSEKSLMKKEIQDFEQKNGVNICKFLIKQLKRIEEKEEPEELKDNDYNQVDKEFIKLMDEMKRIFKMNKQKNKTTQFDEIIDLLFN